MDFDEYLAVSKLSPFSKRSYLYSYRKLNNSGLFNRSIENTGEDGIITNINKITENPYSAAMLLNVCILIKREVGKGYENLVKFRDHLK